MKTKNAPSIYDVYTKRQAAIKAIRAQNVYAINNASRIEMALASQSLKTKPIKLRFAKYECVA